MSFLIVGLGNPDRKYYRTRHNLGFLAVDCLADSVDDGVTEHCCCYSLHMGKLESSNIILMKPGTYMNLSGQALSDYFSEVEGSEDFTVIHDDLDIEFGRIKIQYSGGDGGHRGVRSIIKCLGRSDFTRIRMGIKQDGFRGNAESFVLSNFSDIEEKCIPDLMKRMKDIVSVLLTNGVRVAMNTFNGLPSLRCENGIE